MQASLTFSSTLSKTSSRSRCTRSFVPRATNEPQLQKPVAKPARAPEPTTVPAAAAAAVAAADGTVTIEYQRQQAKAMQKYFLSLKESSRVEQAKVFGWTRKNEITNGRWVMIGFVVGLMTEYATGVSFPDQLKLLLSYMGIADMYD